MRKCVSQFNKIYKMHSHIFQSAWKIMMEYIYTYIIRQKVTAKFEKSIRSVCIFFYRSLLMEITKNYVFHSCTCFIQN